MGSWYAGQNLSGKDNNIVESEALASATVDRFRACPRDGVQRPIVAFDGQDGSSALDRLPDARLIFLAFWLAA